MRNTLTRCALAAAAVTTTLAVAGVARADAPAGDAPTTRPDAAAVQANLKADMGRFQSAFKPTMLTDASARDAAAANVLPALRKVYADFGDMAVARPQTKKQVAATQAQFNTLLALFGDADATARLQAMADDKNPTAATTGKAQQLLVQWWKTAGDADAQAKVADQTEVLAKAHPESVSLTQQLATMAQLGYASPALKDRVQALVAVMKNPLATQLQAASEGADKLKQLAGQPLAVVGRTNDGKPFTTADWKGKVVLVDFWATWCGPCRAELPRVKQMYSQYHDKGLEILGVSNDFDAGALKKYTAANAMPWPELFDAAAAAGQQWNPITQGYGIEGIPTMFLIDKKGVCRTVEARESMEEMIPKMLDEK